MRFIMNAGRSTKQGRQINVGKDTADYEELVTTLIMHPDDMAELGASTGTAVRVRSESGEGRFVCKEHGGKDGKVPRGMIFIAYGPPTCRLMGQTTDGTGMPLSKGWEVEVEAIGEST
ncbi:MAG: formylmethanofuran dehydrogenase [Planctomycetes bacterium]|nr:formylmethanofuran dehydrogenase [Planctomycetota bacterium]|tara:strand:- start:710 stop:1063 length:354 start_codon:yes stop_codon:yes gene_type:complete